MRHSTTLLTPRSSAVSRCAERIHVRTILVPDEQRYAGMGGRELRANFLIESLFLLNALNLFWCDMDRAIIGGAVPGRQPLQLTAPESMRCDFFLERRELGILNIGGPGQVHADGVSFELEKCDGLYIGMGHRDISFTSRNADDPAQFYLLSYPAHTRHPAVLIRQDSVTPVELGSPAGANQRRLYKYIHPDGVRSCQLVMGFTRLAAGSVWNTMPPHTHLRRSEVYLYFDLPPEARVLHLMGRPEETRHLFVAQGQAVLSPAWSIHAGAGTAAYGFCWGMGGENQIFADMDQVSAAELI